MPLPENNELNAVADDLVATIREAFEAGKDIRPVHARGQLVKGTFVPSDGAKHLSKAPIFKSASTNLLARFSCDTGFKDIADTHIDSNPRGLAIRFLLSEDEHTHYDLITTPPLDSPLTVAKASWQCSRPSSARSPRNNSSKTGHSWRGTLVTGNHCGRCRLPPNSGTAFMRSHWTPRTGTERFSGLDWWAFLCENTRLMFQVPPQGVMKMGKEETEEKKPTYLFDNLEERLTAKPPKPTCIADPEKDNLNDSSSEWPEDREFVHLGTISFDRLWTMDEGETPGRDQLRIIFDPKPRYMEGIGVCDDLIIEMRTSVYLKSGMIRREANGVAGRDKVGHKVGH